MSDQELSELFGVFRGLGLEKREPPPIGRVPERQATIWFDVKSCWAMPTWKKLVFLVGLTHTYPRGVAINAAVWHAQVGPWFDEWLARAKAAPLTMLAERRADGSGAVVWREPPTRASVFKRLQELNDSEGRWREAQQKAPAQPAPAAVAPQPLPQVTPQVAQPAPQAVPQPVPRQPQHPAQVVAAMTDPARAWQALASLGLIPAAWFNEPRRRFQHADRWDSFPRTVADCATVAEQLQAMARYEALVFDLFARTAWWQLPLPGAANPPAPSLARWAIYGPMQPGSAPMVPPLLCAVWNALAMSVPDTAMPAYTDTAPMPGWAERGAWAWGAAVGRGLRVPAAHTLPPHLAGRAFAELGDPFAAAREIEAMPYRLFNVDAEGMTLFAHGRA